MVCQDAPVAVPDLDADVIDRLRDCGAESQTTLLLGAGASVTSGFPSWEALARDLLRRSGAVTDPSAASLLIKNQDPLLVAEAARHAAGADWETVVRDALYKPGASYDFSALHLAAAGLLLSAGSRQVKLATLNFDSMLEQALLAEDSRLRVRSVTDSSAGGPFDIHHLHGLVTPTDAADVVLSLRDFTHLGRQDQPWQRRYIERAVDNGALVIAGTSYRDPDVRQWVQIALEQGPDDHAALVLLAREAFNMSRAQFDSARPALMGQWEAIGLRAVPVQDHADAAQAIRELPVLDQPGYLSPSERAIGLWDAIVGDFTALQPAHSDRLAEMVDETLGTLGGGAANATLWIADGRSQLVRWATGDRYYRDPSHLRRVAAGFDSEWIAGKALGSSALLARDVNEHTAGTHRWQSVLAIPIDVERVGGPPLTSAVLSIGLEGPRSSYDEAVWGPMLAGFASEWAGTLDSV